MKTTEYNKLIARFIRVSPKLQSPDLYSLDDLPFFSCTETTPEKCIEAWGKYAKYNSDWNWLMEVVEKIESIGFTFELKKNWVRITRKGESIILSLRGGKSKIEVVYNACVEFIKWYEANESGEFRQD